MIRIKHPVPHRTDLNCGTRFGMIWVGNDGKCQEPAEHEQPLR